MAATRPPFPTQNQPRPQLNFPNVPFNSGHPTYPRPHFNGQSNNGPAMHLKFHFISSITKYNIEMHLI